MIRRLAFLIILIAAPLLASAGETWRVTIAVYPGDDPAATAKRLAATYHGELLAPVGSDGTFVIALSSTRAALLQSDPAVAAVAPATTAPPVAQTVTIESWDLGEYKYDGSGNIRKAGSDVFVYDTMNRLRSGTVAGTTQSYTYDGFGNIRTITTGTEAMAILGVDVATNRMDKTGLESTSAQTANMVATYDASGNLTSYHPDTFQYDALNVITKSNVGGKWRSYVYTASDERIATIELTGATGSETRSDWTIRDTSGKVLRRFSRENGTWQWNQDYVYRGEQMLASDIPGPIKRYHYHLDHLGTPRLITGNGGAQISRHTYYGFGRETVTTATDGERKQFTGHERDAAGVDYMHARYYNPFMGRFLSVDPTWESADLGKPQSWNRYAYVMNNPANMTDPDGKIPIWVEYVMEALSGDGPMFEPGMSLDADKPPRPEPDARAVRTYQTYTKTNPETGEVYTGRTSGTGTPEQNVARRDAGHHKNAEGYDRAQVDKSSTNKDAIRGREQQGIDAHGGARSRGGTSGNAMDGISHRNPKKPSYIKKALREFGEFILNVFVF